MGASSVGTLSVGGPLSVPGMILVYFNFQLKQEVVLSRLSLGVSLLWILYTRPFFVELLKTYSLENTHTLIHTHIPENTHTHSYSRLHPTSSVRGWPSSGYFHRFHRSGVTALSSKGPHDEDTWLCGPEVAVVCWACRRSWLHVILQPFW